MAFRINKALLKGGLVLFISFNIFNFLNFVFHFSMVRMLTVSDYGVLASLFSIVYVLGIFSESIQIVITKYTSNVDKPGRIKNLLKRSLRKSLHFSVGIFFFYLLIAIPLSFFLRINYLLIALNGLIIFSIFLSPITRGILQGTKKFRSLGANMVLESVIKLALAVFFVFIGWRVYGAIIGALVGTFLAFGFSFLSIKEIIGSKESEANTKGIYGYTKPALITMFVVIAFFSVDVVFAKIFFDEVAAGSYAIASTLAKTILFATQPIGRAMFPLSAENSKSNKKKSDNVFLSAMNIVLVISLAALAIFYFYPELIIRLFTGEIVPGAISVLFLLGIAISFISLANIILLYKLSTGKIKGYKSLLIFLLIEMLLLWHFSAEVVQFSIAFITASAIFLWGTLFFLRD